ncbi:MAG: hypothetical protein ACHQNV_11135 [Vicinamibacteria bacterium]
MARGFESKSVADQQEEAQRPRSEDDVPDPAAVTRRRKLEMARVEVVRQMEAAHAEAHREMLRRALAALDKDLAKDSTGH